MASSTGCRRYVPTGNEGRGPQVRQTSNAYRLFMPPAARKLLGRYGQKPPVPDDFSHAKKEKAAALEEMISQLGRADQLLFDVTDDGLSATLRRLIEAHDRLKERESANRSESQSKYIL